MVAPAIYNKGAMPSWVFNFVYISCNPNTYHMIQNNCECGNGYTFWHHRQKRQPRIPHIRFITQNWTHNGTQLNYSIIPRSMMDAMLLWEPALHVNKLATILCCSFDLTSKSSAQCTPIMIGSDFYNYFYILSHAYRKHILKSNWSIKTMLLVTEHVVLLKLLESQTYCWI